MLARTHQREFDLVLDVLDVKRAALRLTAHQRAHHGFGQAADQLADPRGGGALAAIHRQERLRHGDGDLARFEADHRTIATDDLVVRIDTARRHGVGPRNARLQDSSDVRVLLGNLHSVLPSVHRPAPPNRPPPGAAPVHPGCAFEYFY